MAFFSDRFADGRNIKCLPTQVHLNKASPKDQKLPKVTQIQANTDIDVRFNLSTDSDQLDTACGAQAPKTWVFIQIT